MLAVYTIANENFAVFVSLFRSKLKVAGARSDWPIEVSCVIVGGLDLLKIYGHIDGY